MIGMIVCAILAVGMIVLVRVFMIGLVMIVVVTVFVFRHCL
jgi:hypothetical protein